ncbi:hypothetical protein KQX54_020231 [Cotesia glomerata]|uniref:Uncharacterized protein n=1 Tax=Cotesia glomerata TaxID=32391 RepID=A0AAV7J7W9_COTGL|nr:hypothetical protein KQX54_020231 [Cotesia glomerata]
MNKSLYVRDVCKFCLVNELSEVYTSQHLKVSLCIPAFAISRQKALTVMLESVPEQEREHVNGRRQSMRTRLCRKDILLK